MTQPTDGQVYKASDGQWYRWPDPTPHASEEAARGIAFAPPPPPVSTPPPAAWPTATPAPAQWGATVPTASPVQTWQGPVGDGGNWFGRHKVLTALGALLLVGMVAGALGSDDPGDDATAVDTVAGEGVVDDKAPAAAPAQAYAGKQKDDHLADANRQARISGWTVTATPLTTTSRPIFGELTCTTVTLVNRDDEAQSFNQLGWKLQAPSGIIKDATYLGENDLGDVGGNEMAPGGTVSGDVCFRGPAESGQNVLSWQPDVFSHDDRVVWLQTL